MQIEFRQQINSQMHAIGIPIGFVIAIAIAVQEQEEMQGGWEAHGFWKEYILLNS